MRVAALVALVFLSGCAYKTVGHESYQVRGASGASLGSYGIKERADDHSFEHFGTPNAIESLRAEGVEVLVEFDTVSTREVSVSPASEVAAGAADGTVAFVKLARPHTVVERIPKAKLVEVYNKENEKLLEQLRSDQSARIVTAVVREVDTVVLTGLPDESREGLSQPVAAALVSSWLASAPVVEGPIKSESNRHRVYLGGRIVAYEMSHLCWENGKLVGLKTDRPKVDDQLPPGWKDAEPVAQPVVAKD